MKIKNLTILLILLALSMLLISGCDSRDVPTTTDAKYRITRLESSVEKIYADNNVTFSYISAYVKDNNNFGVAEIPVNFQTDRGSVTSSAKTNTSGIAKVPFRDEGQSGLATITAFVYTYSQYDEANITAENSMQVQVSIEEKPPIGELNIEVSSTEFFVNQSVVVRARVFDINLNAVADSTMIRFETDRGHFIADDGETNLGSIAIIPTQNGNAPLRLNVGQQAGIGEVKVKIDTLEALRSFNVKPGNPFNLELATYLADDDLEIVGEPTNETTIDNEYNIVIEANLKDAYNNPNSNKVIRFETNLGSFYNTSESYTQSTDENGVCKVVFTPGLAAGPATIKAYANSDTLSIETLFTIKSDALHSIRFTNSEQIILNVANTGGIDSKVLYVKLYDINGNLVDRATDIYFKIINATIPGTQQGQPAYLSGQDSTGVVHTTSNGGQAAISVVAGAGSGVLQLRVSNDRTALLNQSVPGAIIATKANIIIQAGPPERITWGNIAFDQGTSVGGGLWELLVAVSVKDTYNNPVAYNTSVFFEIEDEANLPATIQGNGYTGNGPELTAIDAGSTTVDSTSSIGVAYTLLTYSASLTYSNIDLNARCVGAYGVEINEPYTIELPWNQPDTDIVATPGHLDFFMPDANDFKWVDVSIRCRDGQGFATQGVEWTFTSDRGVFYDYNVPTFQTDLATSDVDGYAKIKIKIYRAYGLPSPDGVTPGTQQVLIQAIVLGTGITQRTNITILRFPFTDPTAK